MAARRWRLVTSFTTPATSRSSWVVSRSEALAPVARALTARSSGNPDEYQVGTSTAPLSLSRRGDVTNPASWQGNEQPLTKYIVRPREGAVGGGLIPG